MPEMRKTHSGGDESGTQSTPETTMTEYVICEKQELLDIADAIRTKTGSSTKMSLSNMESAIKGLKIGGLSNISIRFPEFDGLGAERFYYTTVDSTGKIALTSVPINELSDKTIQVIRGSVCYCDHNHFNGGTFVIPTNAKVTVLHNGNAFFVHQDISTSITLEYASNAPQ